VQYAEGQGSDERENILDRFVILKIKQNWEKSNDICFLDGVKYWFS